MLLGGCCYFPNKLLQMDLVTEEVAMTFPKSRWFMEGRTAIGTSKGIPRGKSAGVRSKACIVSELWCLNNSFPWCPHFQVMQISTKWWFQGKARSSELMSTRIRGREKKRQYNKIIKSPLTSKKTIKNPLTLTESEFQGSLGLFMDAMWDLGY